MDEVICCYRGLMLVLVVLVLEGDEEIIVCSCESINYND